LRPPSSFRSRTYAIRFERLPWVTGDPAFLQGGGSHSAFTWGVLDRLLEDERLTFDGITATGAGSINAVVLADGLASGGRESAKKHLEVFWTRMSDLVSSSIIAPSFYDRLNPTFGLEQLRAAENGIVVFTSSTGNELSQEKDEWGNGAFTKALVEGLRGAAGRPDVPVVMISDLQGYVPERLFSKRHAS
jgi:Patatin-like phospholipase